MEYEPPRPQYTPPVQAPQARSAMPGWFAMAPVSRVIVFLNVGVFAAQMIFASRFALLDGESSNSFMHPSVHESLAFGANYAPATIGALRLETLVTACFLHGGIIHLAFNMIVLWQAGPLVERSVGSARMAPMYLATGIVSSLTSALVNWLGDSPIYSVGASGAIMGVIASALVLAWRAQGWQSPVTQSIARWLGLNLVIGFIIAKTGTNVDNAAHVGGAISGALVAMMWKRGHVHSAAMRRSILAGCAAAVIACAGVVAWRDTSDPQTFVLREERVDEAVEAAKDGKCSQAVEGIAKAALLWRKEAREVTERKMAIDFECAMRSR